MVDTEKVRSRLNNNLISHNVMWLQATIRELADDLDAARKEIERLQEEVDDLREANESAAVCAKHVAEFVGEDCLVCENERLLETLGEKE